MKKWSKKLICGVLTTAMVLMMAACGDGREDGDQTDSSGSVSSGTESVDKTESAGIHHVEITIKDYGKISVELNGDKAPITVENFLKLAGDGFYDGLTFHRIIDGFMMQGGDPLGTGMGGAEEKIKGEFSENGVENDLSHTRGADRKSVV